MSGTMGGFTWDDLRDQVYFLKGLKSAGELTLTPREKTLIHSLVRGLRERGISWEQHVTENTVDTEIRRLRDKFGAGSRDQLIFLVRETFPEAFLNETGDLISGSSVF